MSRVIDLLRKSVLGSLILLGLSSVADAQDPVDTALAKARRIFTQAWQTPLNHQYAPHLLLDARAVLADAEQRRQRLGLFDEDETPAEQTDRILYQAWLVEQTILLAESLVQRRLLEQQIDSLTREKQQRQQRLARLPRQPPDPADPPPSRSIPHSHTVTLGGELFPPQRPVISRRLIQELQPLAAFLVQHPDRRIRIEGHSDDSGDPVTNLRRSEQRADAVKAILIDHGVQPDRITRFGYGAARPVADDSTAAGRRRNRRVELIITHHLQD